VIAVYGFVLLAASTVTNVWLVSSEDSRDYNLWFVWLGIGGLGLAIFLVPTAFWWWRPGRTSYDVGDGRLTVSRGTTVLFDCSCSDIFGIWVRGGSSWPDLLNPKTNIADGKFPHLVVWTDEKFQAPPILRAGRSAARDLQLALIDACRANGARASLTGS
jgi:hypothetical protein